MDPLYQSISFSVSRLITHRYSTSFSIGVRSLSAALRDPIYSLYGFVRLADEIVDRFHDFDKAALLDDFEADFYKSLEQGISMNPVLNAFQQTVRTYGLDRSLIDAFLRSMRMDLSKQTYTEVEMRQYIYGSADVVGLMCLKIFVGGNQAQYDELSPYAMRLGTAFQKINFLRDLKQDTLELQRSYFPQLQEMPWGEACKKALENDVMNDFKEARMGILRLPESARLGVYVAYLYYLALTKKIVRTSAEDLMKKRISVCNLHKLSLLVRAYIQVKGKLLW
ncbi:MAG: phytoene/squalene synthase family protein [Bacteroidales bacterium]|nr:phytoene/squalene synthase family protein [Bacteroidales bacterium]